MLQIPPSLKSGMMMFILVLGIATAGLYGGAVLVDVPNKVAADDEVDDGPVIPGGPVNVTIIGKNILFDKRSFSAGVDSDVTVTFDNQDPGVLHNIAFYTSRAATTLIPNSSSPVLPGPRVDVVNFKAPSSPGSYFFRCDVHPDTMTGAMTVR